MGKLIALYDSSRRSAGVPNTENRRCDSQFMEFNTLCLILSIAAVVLCAVFFAAGVLYRKKVAEKQIGSAEEEARRIINEAIKGGESKKREMLLEAKEEIHKSRSEYEQEVKERRAEVSKQERRLQQKEEALDKKINLHEKKEDELAKKIAAIDKKQEEVDSLKRSQMVFIIPDIPRVAIKSVKTALSVCRLVLP